MASSFTRFSRSHNDASQSVGLVWTSDQLVAETSTWHYATLTTSIHALGGIRTHNLSRRVAADLRLGPCGHWDRLRKPVPTTITCIDKIILRFPIQGVWNEVQSSIFYFASERTGKVEENKANGWDLAWSFYWQRNANHNPPLWHFAWGHEPYVLRTEASGHGSWTWLLWHSRRPSTLHKQYVYPLSIP